VIEEQVSLWGPAGVVRSAPSPGALDQYGRYFVIGGLVGVMTLLLREGIARITGDTPSRYLLSVLAAYAIGILVSFLLHKHLTFRERLATPAHPLHSALLRFTLIALIGMALTGGLAVGVRYLLVLDAIFFAYSGAVAFVIASLLTSVVTYVLNARLSF